MSEDAALDTFVNEIEVLRDPSHVRNYRISEWIATLQAAGIDARALRNWGIRMDMPTWTQRMRTSAQNIERIMHLFSTASLEVCDYLRIENSSGVFTFALPATLYMGTKTAP